MNNPFDYGKPVSGEYFFERVALDKEMENYVSNRISVVIIGSRRHGKTSFINNFLKRQRKAGYAAVSVDAFNVNSHKDFLIQLVGAISEETSLTGKMYNWVKSIGSITPNVSIEIDSTTGSPSLSVKLSKAKESDVKQAIIKTLGTLPGLSKKVILSIDEFQKVGELEDKGWLEATLRSNMQKTKNISYIYTGSRRAVIEEMFNTSRRPFYRSSNIIQFPSLEPEFTEWVENRFKTVGVECDKIAIDHLRKEVDDSPNYVQQVCFHLVSHGSIKITVKEVDEFLKKVSNQATYSYEALMNTLTHNQIMALRMLVKEGDISYSKDKLEKYELKTSSRSQSAERALISKQIIEKDPKNKLLKFDDPMFRIWLKQTYA